jgi:hypothetical protein
VFTASSCLHEEMGAIDKNSTVKKEKLSQTELMKGRITETTLE